MAFPSIVVTSDNFDYLDLIKERLIDAGYPQVRCGLQQSAVFDLVLREQPDLVLLDISIGHPGGGWRTLDLLRHGLRHHTCAGDSQSDQLLVHHESPLLN